MNERSLGTRLRLVSAAALMTPLLAVAQSCTVSATAVSFGTYNVLSPTPTDANGTVTLSCAAHPVALVLGYTISLSTGGSGSFAPRRLSSGAHQLQYQLYTNLPRTAIWGDGSAGTSVVSGGLTLSLIVPASAPHAVYGRIPAQQSAAVAGAHADVITVTVAY